MEKKLLKAAVFAVMLGVAGSAMAENYNPLPTENTIDGDKVNQTVIGTGNRVAGNDSSAYGSNNKATADESTAIGYNAQASAKDATALGSYVEASGQNSLALGSGTNQKNTTAGGAYSVAIGYLTQVATEATNATAIGYKADAKATNTIVIGTEAAATKDATSGVALGQKSNVSATNAVALGVSSYAASADAVAIGYGSRVSTNSADGLAIGTNAYVKKAGSVAIGKDSAVSANSYSSVTDDVVSFGHTSTDLKVGTDGSDEQYGNILTRRLVNVTAGYQDTDAVNFSQIKTTARTGADLKNGTYIKSSLETDQETGVTSLNTEGTVGKNIAALDAKMVATKTDTINTVDLGNSNKIVSNDGTVLATFKSSKLGAEATEAEKLAATDFVTNGDVYAAIAARAQTVNLDATTTHTVNNKTIYGNQIASNDGTVLATFEVESGNVPVEGSKKFISSGQAYAGDVKKQTITLDTDKKENIIVNNNKDELVTMQAAKYETNDKGFVSGGLLWSHSIAEGQTPSFTTTSTGATAADDDTNVIRDNDGKALVRFTEGVVAVEGGALGATNTDTNFVSARNAYANDVAYAQTFTLDGNTLSGDFVTNAGATVGTVNITRGSVGENNMGFVTGHDVWLAIAKYNQTIDFSKVDTSTNSSTTNDTGSNGDGADDATGGDTGSGEEGGGQGGSDSGDTSGQASNKIYTNDGREIAEFKQAEIKEGDTGFATGGQVYGQALEEGQEVSFDSEKNVIKNNDGTTLVTFTKAEVKEDNTGFATGGQVWSNAIAVDQTISFEEGKNVIKDNAGNKLVTFQSGEAKEGDTGFVSGDAAWKGDVKKATLTLESGKDAVIQNNNGDDLVTIEHGKVEEGNTGFVSGGDVYENTKNIKADISKDIETVKTEVKENFEKVNTEIADVNTRVDETQQNLATLGGQVNEVEDRVSKVGAGAAALAALHPLDYDPNAKLTFAVGYGNYRSKSAAAIGAFVRPNNRFMWSLAATMGNGENMYNTGLSFAIGSGKGIRMSRAELDFKVGQLSDSLTQMTAEHQTFARDNAQQDAAILDLHARLKRVEEILSQLTAQ